MKAFFDTNIFIYSVSVAPEDAEKRRVALALISDSDIHLSLQVVQEFIHTCSRKIRIGHGHEALRRSAQRLLGFPCQQPGPASILRSLEIHQSYQISYWDAAIIAAARELGCQTIYTEDLAHGQIYDGVKAINPFR